MNKVSKKQFAKIFICYCRMDSNAVNSLYSHLRSDGMDVWLDTENLQPGQNWQHEIRKAILKSEVVLVCLSQKFNEQQGYRHKELKLALEKAKMLYDQVFIIPIRLEKCDLSEYLRHLHRVDLFEPIGYKKLLHALKRLEDSGE